MRISLIGIALLALGTPASAEVVVHLDDMGSPLAGHTAYKLWFSGEHLTMLSGRFEGPMNQAWFLDVLPTPMLETASLLGAEVDKDTHLLFMGDEILSVVAPHEDGPGTGSWLANADNSDDFLFVLTPTAQSDPRDIAWIVVPDGQRVVANLWVWYLDPWGQKEGWLPEIIIPEPGGVALLSLGGLALFRRRRRCADRSGEEVKAVWGPARAYLARQSWRKGGGPRKAGIATIVVLALAALANAEMVVHLDNMGSPLPEHTAYKLWFSGEQLTSLRGRFEGPMNQVWFAYALPTPMLETANFLGADIEKDSHLLFLADELIPIRTPAEDGPGTGSWLSNTDNTKDFVFGIKGDFQSDPRDIAWIVVPDGQIVVANLSVTSVQAPTARWLPEIVIPEPVTVALLGLGAAALVSRRRNRRSV